MWFGVGRKLACRECSRSRPNRLKDVIKRVRLRVLAWPGALFNRTQKGCETAGKRSLTNVAPSFKQLFAGG